MKSHIFVSKTNERNGKYQECCVHVFLNVERNTKKKKEKRIVSEVLSTKPNELNNLCATNC